MFLTKSNTSFLLYILLASWYAYLVYWQKGASDIHYLWFAAAFLSYFVWRILKVPNHAIGLAAGWLIPISLTQFLGNLFMEPTVEGNSAGGWAFVGYALLFQCFINVFTLEWPFENKSWKIGFASIGFVGSMVLLYLFSFQFFAKQVVEIFNPQYLMHSYKALSTLALLLLLYATLVFYIVKKVSSPVLYVFPIFSLILCLSGFNYHLGQIMMNVFILAIAILFIVKGFSLKNLYQLNMGLLIFSLLRMREGRARTIPGMSTTCHWHSHGVLLWN